MCDLVRTHWCMQVEVFLEVATLDISTPLVGALNGGATVFPTSTAVDFLPKVRDLIAGHRRACRADVRTPGCTGGACTTDGAHAADGKRDCCAEGWRRLSWCGVLIAAMMSWLTS
jgi:hypothetical protein